MKKYLCVVALLMLPAAAVAAQTFTKQFTIVGVAQPALIADLNIANCTAPAGGVQTCTVNSAPGVTSIPVGTVIGAISLVMNPAGSAVPATLALSVNDCTTATPPVCTASTHFQVSSPKMPSNIVVGPAALGLNGTGSTTFAIQMVASQ